MLKIENAQKKNCGISLACLNLVKGCNHYRCIKTTYLRIVKMISLLEKSTTVFEGNSPNLLMLDHSMMSGSVAAMSIYARYRFAFGLHLISCVSRRFLVRYLAAINDELTFLIKSEMFLSNGKRKLLTDLREFINSSCRDTMPSQPKSVTRVQRSWTSAFSIEPIALEVAMMRSGSAYFGTSFPRPHARSAARISGSPIARSVISPNAFICV